MTEVCILWFLPPGGDDADAILVGVYSSRASALAAIERLADRPGFRDDPRLVDDPDDAGFFIEPYALDEDHWTEGFRTEAG